jgi:hypothetical protein
MKQGNCVECPCKNNKGTICPAGFTVKFYWDAAGKFHPCTTTSGVGGLK